MGSKAGRLVKGSMLRMVEFVSHSLVGLLLMPFIVHSLGDRMYGLWLLVGSFLGYYGLMDFGLNSAVQRYVSRAKGLDDYEETNRVVNTAIAIFLVIGVVALLLSAVLAAAVPLLIDDMAETAVFRTVIMILGVSFAVGFPLRVFSGILTANVRYDLSTGVDLLKLAVRTGLVVLLLSHGYGIVALALVTFFADTGGYFARFLIVRRLYPRIVLSRRFVERSRVRSLFGYSTFTFIAGLADQLRFNVDNLVITAFLGLSLVTPYSIGARLVMYFMAFMLAAVGMLSPVFSAYEARNDYARITDKFLMTTKISGYLSFLVGGLLIIFGKAFIVRWMGPDYLSSYPILVLLTVPVMLALMQSPSVQLMYGISKHRFFAVSNISEGVANLLLSLILVDRYGITGVALGTAIPMVAVKLFVQPVYTCRAIGLDLKTYYLGTLVPVLVKSSLVLALIWGAVRSLIEPDYLSLTTLTTGAAVFFAAAALATGFTSGEREYFGKVLARRLPLPGMRKTAG